jgi:hypothetical protein
MELRQVCRDKRHSGARRAQLLGAFKRLFPVRDALRVQAAQLNEA